MDAQLRAGRDRVVLDALPALTLGLALLQVALSVIHATLGAAVERPFVFVDGFSAALSAALWLALRRGALPERWAQPFAAGCIALATLITMLHLRFIDDPMQSLMLALILVGSGSILMSLRWLAVVGTLSLLGWLAVMASLGFPPPTRRLGVALVGSWALGAMVLGARLRSFRRLEELRAEREARLQSDIVAAQQLTESMRQSEESHRLLFEQSPVPMWVVETKTLRFLSVNDAAVRHYGYSRAEFLDLTLPDLHPPEEVPRLLEDLANEASEGLPVSTIHRTKDGTAIDVEVVAHGTTFGGWNAILAVLQDVTERRKSEEALRRSRESFQKLFEEAPIGMAIIASGITFTKVNRALCAMLGYAPEELRGLTFDRVVDPADLDAHLEATGRFFEGAISSFKLEARYIRKSGDALWGSLTVERIEDSTGQTLFILVMVEDVGERRRFAQERERTIEDLTAALANVKTLSGLIPICASCKKIRDDKGYWNQVEVYVRDHSDAEFSHGICPDCMKTLYGK